MLGKAHGGHGAGAVPGTLGPNGVWMEMYMEQQGGQDVDNTEEELLTSNKICYVSQKLR